MNTDTSAQIFPLEDSEAVHELPLWLASVRAIVLPTWRHLAASG